MTAPVRAPLSAPHRALAVVAAALLVLTVIALVPRPAAASAGTGVDGERATFLVLLQPGVDPAQAGRELAGQHGGELGFVYRHAVRGFAVTLPEQAAAGLARDRRVASVHRDQVFTLAAQTTPTGVARTFAPNNAQMDIDGGGPGVDVDIAVLDTGLDMAHEDLNDVGGANCTSSDETSTTCSDGGYQDGHGHGTHVGGSAAAVDNGVGVVGTAPGARLYGLKVLGDDGVGYESWIVAAIDWVLAHNADSTKNPIEVANMSLGCECESPTQDAAIAKAVAAGVTFVVAAGNAAKDASTFNPANHPDVITVSALADANGKPGGGGRFSCTALLEKDDTLANFSNRGSLVEIAAPGMCISSTVPGGYGTKSGTSMASPHVAGAIGVLASSRPGALPADLETLLRGEGNLDWTDDSGDGVHEPLLDVSDGAVFSPAWAGDTATTNAAPTASFTYSCTDLTCTFDGSGSSDSDGTISSWHWAFGDGTTASGTTASHPYAAGGTYTVTLTVTDGGGATGTSSQSVKVSAPSSTAISLTASGYKVKGGQTVDLSWAGAAGESVDVHRNGQVVATTENDGAYTESPGKGGGSYTYKVCEAGTASCSNEATVTF